MVTDESSLRALVYGGAVLGGGGGGSLAAGLKSVRRTLEIGEPRIVSLADLPPSAIIATLSAVGSAGNTSGSALEEAHFRRAIDLFRRFANRNVDGFISSEVGPRAVTYGWCESARTGVPIVDAPANGRAHPLFLMGSLGLHKQRGYTPAAVAVGGHKTSADYAEIAIRTSVVKAARIVRGHAAGSKTALAVVRNAVPARYLKDNAAVGGLEFAGKVGATLLAASQGGASSILRALSRLMGGRVLAEGMIVARRLSDRRGFSIGVVQVRRRDGSRVTIPVCNEFMAVLYDAQPVVSFPDLISLFDLSSGLPLASSEAEVSRPVAVFAVPRDRLILGRTMFDRSLLTQVERLVGPQSIVWS
jgi:DUF917 family protein